MSKAKEQTTDTIDKSGVLHKAVNGLQGKTLINLSKPHSKEVLVQIQGRAERVCSGFPQNILVRLTHNGGAQRCSVSGPTIYLIHTTLLYTYIMTNKHFTYYTRKCYVGVFFTICQRKQNL